MGHQIRATIVDFAVLIALPTVASAGWALLRRWKIQDNTVAPKVLGLGLAVLTIAWVLWGIYKA